MADFWSTYLTYIGLFAALVFFTLALINFMMGGYFFPFLRVKISNGKKILVRVKGLTQDHFKVGKINEGNLIYKHNKTIKQLSIPKDEAGKMQQAIFRGAGVYYVIVDEEKNAIVKLDFSTVSGFDAEKWNNLLERALTKPQTMNTDTKIIIFLIIVVIVGLIIVGFMTKSLGDKINTLQSLSQTAITASKTLTTGGV